MALAGRTAETATATLSRMTPDSLILAGGVAAGGYRGCCLRLFFRRPDHRSLELALRDEQREAAGELRQQLIAWRPRRNSGSRVSAPASTN